jgi:Phasin protein
MAEAKKASTKRTKSTQNADLVEMAAVPAAATAETLRDTAPASQDAVPGTKPIEAGAIFSSVREQGNVFRQAVSEAAAASAKGVLEVNGKIIDALNTQSNAALDLWRSAFSPSPLPEAFQAQTSATRQAYETASAQWKDIADATALWVTKSLEPLQSALHRQGR